MPRSTYRRRRFHLHLLMTQLMLLLLSSSFGNSSEIINDEIDVDVSSLSEIVDNGIIDSSSPEIDDDDVDDGRSSEMIGDEINYDSSSDIAGNDIEAGGYFSAMEQHYFGHEIDFLARQAMTLGDHSNANGSSKESSISNSHTEEKLHRLRFIEESLQMELDYIRRFRETKAKAKDSLDAKLENYAKPRRHYAERHYVDKQRGIKRFGMKETNRDAISLKDIIINKIIDVKWWRWVPDPFFVDILESIERSLFTPEQWDALFGMYYDRLACGKHARDQNKPLYTLEQFDALWKAFQQSTLFPYPIPQPEEWPDEPYSTNYTTDGKGRGNFATRDIPEGSLVHGGHPSTVFFLDNRSYFLFVISLPKTAACDVLEWAWQQDLTNSGNVVVCLNIGEGSFTNGASYKNSTNIDRKTKTSLGFYALRDIAEGEELLYDYSSLGQT